MGLEVQGGKVMTDQDEKITVNDKEVTQQQFQEIKENLKNSERLTEVSPKEYRKLERMQG